jgi:hypothetical protein
MAGARHAFPGRECFHSEATRGRDVVLWAGASTMTLHPSACCWLQLLASRLRGASADVESLCLAQPPLPRSPFCLLSRLCPPFCAAHTALGRNTTSSACTRRSEHANRLRNPCRQFGATTADNHIQHSPCAVTSHQSPRPPARCSHSPKRPAEPLCLHTITLVCCFLWAHNLPRRHSSSTSTRH